MDEPPELHQLVLLNVRYEAPDLYCVEFEDRDTGDRVKGRIRLARANGIIGGEPEPDVFGSWMGDAESVRSVVAAVVAVDTARALSLRDHK